MCVKAKEMRNMIATLNDLLFPTGQGFLNTLNQ